MLMRDGYDFVYALILFRVEIPLTSRAALNCIIHNLYSCT